MLPKILKNFNVFVDGFGYAGIVDEVTLPKLSIKTEEYRAGGMDMPIEIDMGMEKIEAELTFSEYNPKLFKLFGLVHGSETSISLRGAMQGGGNNSAVVVTLRGSFKEIDSGNWKAGDKASLKCMITASYYKLDIDSETLVEIDAINMIRLVNGVDQLSAMRTAIGI